MKLNPKEYFCSYINVNVANFGYGNCTITVDDGKLSIADIRRTEKQLMEANSSKQVIILNIVPIHIKKEILK